MKEMIIKQIEEQMLNVLDNAQLAYLRKTLENSLNGLTIVGDKKGQDCLFFKHTNSEYVEMFLAAKRIEGCSERTLKYYSHELEKALINNELNVTQMTTEILRKYLSDHQKNSKCTKVSIDNIRRILSSFYGWLEEENYIIKSPMKRIHKIKTDKMVKETYSDENLEKLRDNVSNKRDLAIIDLLTSTGMRVGELVRLNTKDIDFENRECVVFGKGNKERPVYFDARTKIHLMEYLDSRKDNNEALFVTLDMPYSRLKISGVEIRLRNYGKNLGIDKVHPHKFRRTMATRAIDKGMPIEQVQSLLGHSQIDTTMKYAMVNQNNVKQSHKKYIG